MGQSSVIALFKYLKACVEKPYSVSLRPTPEYAQEAEIGGGAPPEPSISSWAFSTPVQLGRTT